MRQRALGAVRGKQWAEAAQIYKALIEEAGERRQALKPDDLANLGALLRKLGRAQEAIEHYQLWIRQFPGHEQLRLNAINCAIEFNNYELAENWISAGLAISNNQPELQLAKARLEQRQGKLAEAQQQIEQILGSGTQLLGAWLELALVRQRLGDLRGALQANEQAAAMAPESSAAWGNQITLLKELGLLEQAQSLLNQMSEDMRQQPEVRRAATHLWMEQQLMTEAEAELAELCRLQPQDAGQWLNRAACLRHLKHFLAAVRVLKQGLRWVPDHQQLQESLGHCLAEISQPKRGMALLRRCLNWDDTLSDGSHASLQFLGAGYGTLSSKERQELAQAWEKRKKKEGVGPLWADRIREPLAGRRLRVGYLSADYCNHPVGRFLAPLLKGHNHTAVEVWGLNCGPHHDNMTSELRANCDHWLELRFGSDLDVARLIADQNLDVLVELGGFTGLSRIGAVVHRPAPVQLSYLGYFAPTYLNAVDGWIGDRVLFESLNSIDQKAHRLVEIEGGYMAFQDTELPAQMPITCRHFRFGCFNHSRKLSAQTIELFCAVMAAAPQTQLVLKSVSFVEAAERERIRKVFSRAGLAEDRLIILPWVEGRSQHLACYTDMDVALDPLPYGGATTTCEALAMGVPVVTLAGEGMVGRLSASILASAGLTDWIANNTEEFVGIARRMVCDRPRTVEEREQLRDSIQQSSLGDGQRLARNLESHYRSLTSEVLAASR